MRRLALAPAALLLIAAGALPIAVPAQAAPGPPGSYLFVVDASDVKVIPEKGTAARIVLEDASAMRFSDRPYRHVRPISLRGMLNAFGWSPTTLKLKDPTPNASISIAGQRSRIVDVGKASIRDGKLVLDVIGIDGPLTAMRGPGSVFLDNASGSAQSARLTPEVIATVSIVPTGPLQFAVAVAIEGRRVATLSPSSPSARILASVPGDTPTDLDLTVTASFGQRWITVTFTGYATTGSRVPVRATATLDGNF